MPRTANGKVTLVNSCFTVTTRVVGGRLAATSATSCETLAPLATELTGTPASRAQASRASATGLSNSGGCLLPVRQAEIARTIVSATDTGGTPTLAVLR